MNQLHPEKRGKKLSSVVAFQDEAGAVTLYIKPAPHSLPFAILQANIAGPKVKK